MRTTVRLVAAAAALLACFGGAQGAINGTLGAVVAPFYDGSNGSTSFLRLFGGVQGTGSTFTISVVSTTSGATLGTTTITVPKNASPQFSFSTIIAKAGAASQADHGYALYITNPEQTSGYQHVTFNGVSTLFENVSVCSHLVSEVVTPLFPSLVATNLHTTALANNTYPTQIDLHNYWNAPVTYGVYVYDAGTADNAGTIRAGSGTMMGSKTYTVGANATKSLSVSQLQSDIGWTPNSTQLHANIIVTDVANQAPAELLGINIGTNIGGFVNMATTCSVNAPPAPASNTGGGGTVGGGDTGGAYTS